MAHNDAAQNLKYLTRCHYFGKLEHWEYIAGAMILRIRTYTATEYFGGSQVIRIYVPTNLERVLADRLITGENYFIIAAPYKLTYDKTYRHRVDLLLNIFQEVT